MDIREFIAARLDEDEALARAALMSMNDTGEWSAHHANGLGVVKERGYYVVCSYMAHETADHIARHGPARALRDVESARKLLDLAEYLSGWSREHNSSLTDEQIKDARWAADQMLRAYAMRWADHPHYRTEWTP